MKTGAIAVVALMLGFFIGWYFGRQATSHFVHERFENAINGYPSGWVTSMWSVADVMPSMTKDKLRETLSYAHQYNQKLIDEYQIKNFYNGFLALRFQQLIDKGDTNKVQAILSETICRFAQRVDEGDYKGTNQEAAAKAMIQQWRSRTNSLTSKSTVGTETHP